MSITAIYFLNASHYIKPEETLLSYMLVNKKFYLILYFPAYSFWGLLLLLKKQTQGPHKLDPLESKIRILANPWSLRIWIHNYFRTWSRSLRIQSSWPRLDPIFVRQFISILSDQSLNTHLLRHWSACVWLQ